METQKSLHDLTFAELVDEATRSIHSDLLTNGGQGMRSAVFRWMSTAITWKDLFDKKHSSRNSEVE